MRKLIVCAFKLEYVVYVKDKTRNQEVEYVSVKPQNKTKWFVKGMRAFIIASSIFFAVM